MVYVGVPPDNNIKKWILPAGSRDIRRKCQLNKENRAAGMETSHANVLR